MDDTRDIHLHPPVWAPLVVLLAVLIGGGFYVYGKKIEIREATPATISVSGEGKASIAPDIAQLQFGFQATRLPTAKAAMDSLGKSMQAVIDAVKKAGVEDKDIKTQSLSLSPSYDWREGTQIMRGFDASQSLIVKVRDMDKASDVLAAATNAGANQVGGVSFVIDDPEKARAEARQEAIEQAQQKAATLADQLGMKLGKLKNFSEGGGYAPPMPMYARDMAMEKLGVGGGVAETPIPVGEEEIAVQVTLMYELK